MEIWKDIEGYEGYYQVSNKGNVKSLERKYWNGKTWATKKEKILSKTKTSTGYWKVDLQVNKNKKSFKVHRLVAFAFIPKVEGKELINHKDGDPLNNNVENLEWCTYKENAKHAHENGLTINNLIPNRNEILEEYKEGNKTIDFLAKKYKTSNDNLKKWLESQGVDVKKTSDWNNKYKIDKKELIADFEKGKTNKELAMKYNTNSALIGTYKYKWKKGELTK